MKKKRIRKEKMTVLHPQTPTNTKNTYSINSSHDKINERYNNLSMLFIVNACVRLSYL